MEGLQGQQSLIDAVDDRVWAEIHLVPAAEKQLPEQ